MSQSLITSLHSPHVERVKALLGSKGKKFRAAESVFVADGMQSLRSAIAPRFSDAPKLIKVYLTEAGLERVNKDNLHIPLEPHDIIMVSDAVMDAMASTESPQGVLSLCKYRSANRDALGYKKIAYFWETQDPGNAGTAIRTADACGFDFVAFSPGSVDIYSPKVIRSTAGSTWNIPVLEGVTLQEIQELAAEKSFSLYAFDGTSDLSFSTIPSTGNMALIFGNEARGLPALPEAFTSVRIPMAGYAESFNVASAAAIAMYSLSGLALS